MTTTRQIIATSAGFAIEPQNKRMDRYILAQSSKTIPKICFLGTASGDSKGYIKRFYNFFGKEQCMPSHLPLFKTTVTNLERFILDQDIIYVGGGNTKSMLAIWQSWGIDKCLLKAYDQGVILSGISAGSLCWFQQGLTDSIPGNHYAIECLGIIKGSNCPFYGINQKKDRRFKQLVKNKTLASGICSELGVGLHYIDGHLHKTISSRKKAMAYQFTLTDNRLIKTGITPQYLTN